MILHQNYGAPQNSRMPEAGGERIAEKTAGNYVSWGLRRSISGPIPLQHHSDFSRAKECTKEELTHPAGMQCGAPTSQFGIWTFEGFSYTHQYYGSVLQKDHFTILSDTLKWGRGHPVP